MEDLSKFNQIDSLYEIALLLVDLFWFRFYCAGFFAT